MKQLIIAVMLISLTAQAQNDKSTQAILALVKQKEDLALQKEKNVKPVVFSHPNKDYILSLSKLDVSGAQDFAKNIAASGKNKWEFSKAQENTKGDYFVISYSSGEKVLKIIFNVYYEGQNKALEIQGTKTYKFYEAWGSYLDLFPTWKKIFRPDVELEKTVDDLNSQELINRPENINFKIKGSDDQWRITNWS